jgi:rhodanese-related sulfurtransferase
MLGFSILLSVNLLGCSAADAQDAVSLEFARTEAESGRAVLIDIREPQEHATGVAKNAQLLPMQQLGTRLSEIPKWVFRRIVTGHSADRDRCPEEG